MINGLYDKNYPLNSVVDYHWTEHNDDELKKTLADTIITINHSDSYHIEIQMHPDQDIVMRVFEYGYHHAVTSRDGKDVLRFPNPIILYLYEGGNTANYQELLIDFGEQGNFPYRVSVFRYLKMSPEELDQKKLIVLIPFQLLRLRKAIEKERTAENLEKLKHLIRHDIIDTINKNIAAGNITVSEGRKLKQVTLQLYRHIYEKYDELEKAGVNQMAEEAMILDIDIIEYEHKKELQRLTQEVTERVAGEKDKIIQEMAEKLRSMGVSEEEIASLTKKG